MLRAALQVSPDNLPLRQHMAQLLMGMGDAIAAEPEYISAIALTTPQMPEHTDLTLGLARCYTQQSKNQQALSTIGCGPVVQLTEEHLGVRMGGELVA